MKYNSEKHRRRSLRLKGYDYSQAGAYFATICTRDRNCLFGEVKEDKMILNEYGKIVQKLWEDIPAKYQNVQRDQFIIMPNHIHGILEIQDNMGRGEVSSPDSFLPDSKPNLSKQKGGETPPLLQTPTLGRIIAYLKYQCAKNKSTLSETHQAYHYGNVIITSISSVTRMN